MDKQVVINEIMEGCRAVRCLRPLVHMIPNYVTAGICADAVAAIGGRPLMASAPEEMEEITALSDGLVINLGQPSEEKFRACKAAMETAADSGLPVLLDPVGAGASGYRRNMTRHLTELPWSGVIKGNSSEIQTVLTGSLSHEGVDSLTEFENVSASRAFFRQMEEQRRSLVLSSTGAVDRIFWKDGSSGKIHEIILKHEAERKNVMVGTGCIAGALGGTLMAAAGKRRAPLEFERIAVLAAAASAMVAFAGEEDTISGTGRQNSCGFGVCENSTPGYGTYQVRLLDRLSRPDEKAFAGYLERNLELKEESNEG